jgi:hypothetical protein
MSQQSERDLSAADCNVLYGTKAISKWLGMSIQQCRPLIDDGTIPTFKPPGRSIRCALKSAVNAAWEKYAEIHRNKSAAAT